MAITNLQMKVAYPANMTNLPLLIIMDGWDATFIDDSTFVRLAGYGLFVVQPPMRGRVGSSGTRDASGREIYDIYDAIKEVQRIFSDRISDKIGIVGWSGGGGNALAAACKFPDLFNVVVSNFGMSDYGRDATNGWYQQTNAYYKTGIATAVGGTPVAVPNNYYARDAVAAISNFKNGFLYLFHDELDATVQHVHSERIAGTMDAAGLTNYSKNISKSGDTYRYEHTMDIDGTTEIYTESMWVTKLKTQAAWTIESSGTITVIGYIVTRRFTIWLDQGLTSAATVVYDTAAGTYAVTPLTTANISVSITQGSLTASGTAAAGDTTNFTVS